MMAKENATQAEKDLQAQVEQLRKEISQITSTLGEVGSEKLHQVKDKAGRLYASAKANGEEAVSQAKEKIHDLEGQVSECVRNKPVTSLAVAAGVGFLIALLVRR
ncbi:DUF883 family protein [Bartonella tamiae]|uniref:DUF883 domain-containing protein n=1 Tax=Bartonella tamiae Th239 TaxID=1094558 RepID=J1K3K9_9HYPH|nr:DUF883 family protein [Bartonella tamiae]EJF91725.1 hypothetical protein ME5_00104 [Bartonella tamiae Th239]EJF92607.1 hypothetical protein MEG_01777 [Bartonella tamiae Th307]